DRPGAAGPPGGRDHGHRLLPGPARSGRGPPADDPRRGRGVRQREPRDRGRGGRLIAMDASFAGFLVIAAVAIVTPGPHNAPPIRNTLLGGRRTGFGTALGVASGQSVWTLATSLGLTAVLLASGPAFEVLRWLGVAYLAYLGIASLIAAIRP